MEEQYGPPCPFCERAWPYMGSEPIRGCDGCLRVSHGEKERVLALFEEARQQFESAVEAMEQADRYADRAEQTASTNPSFSQALVDKDSSIVQAAQGDFRRQRHHSRNGEVKRKNTLSGIPGG